MLRRALISSRLVNSIAECRTEAGLWVFGQQRHRLRKETWPNTIVRRHAEKMTASGQLDRPIFVEHDTAVDLVSDKANRLVPTGKLLDDFNAVVGRRIINDDDFQRLICLLLQALERFWQKMGVIVVGEKHGEGRFSHITPHFSRTW